MKSHNLVGDLLGDLTGVRAISCDLFDTLLVRQSGAPQTVFHSLALKAQRLGMLPCSLTQSGFVSMREQAQEMTYQDFGHFREPTLRDIYARLQNVIPDPESLMDLELEIERRSIRGNRLLIEALTNYREAGVEILLVTDTYFSRDEVDRLLDSCDIPLALREYLYVSSELQLSKRCGSIYPIIVERHTQGKPNSLLHIGDNIRSDVLQAKAAGLRTFHWPYKNEEDVRPQQFATPEVGAHFTSVSSLAAALSPFDGDSLQGAGFKLGATVYGPALHGFLNWVIKVATEEKCDAIAPLMRESFTIHPLLERLAAGQTQTIPLIPLAVSRVATKHVDLHQESNDDFAALFLDFACVSVDELLRLLGVGQYSERLDLGSLPVSTRLAALMRPEYSNSLRALKSLLRKPQVIDLSRDFFWEKSELLTKYLLSTIGRNRRALSVDVGFQGQIQRNLDLRTQGTGLAFSHALMIGRSSVAERSLTGGRCFSYVSMTRNNADKIQRIHRAAPVIEQVLMGPVGSVVGYHAKNSEVVPIHDCFERHTEYAEFKRPIQQGIFCFFDVCAAQQDKHSPDSIHKDSLDPEMPAMVLNKLDQLVSAPDAQTALLFAHLKDELNNGTSRAEPICLHPDRLKEDTPLWEAESLAAQSIWVAGTRVLLGTQRTEERETASFRLVDRSKLLIWGAGETLGDLIRAGMLSELEVVGLVDSSPIVQGNLRYGFVVQPPTHIAAHTGVPVLIASRKFKHEISEQIENICLRAGVGKPVLLTL